MKVYVRWAKTEQDVEPSLVSLEIWKSDKLLNIEIRLRIHAVGQFGQQPFDAEIKGIKLCRDKKFTKALDQTTAQKAFASLAGKEFPFEAKWRAFGFLWPRRFVGRISSD